VRRAALLAAAVAVLCAGCGGGGGTATVEQPVRLFRGTVLSPPVPAPAFTLRDQSGQQVSLAAQRGRYVVVTFLYTHCPDVCPVIAGNLNTALKSPVARRAGLRVLAVSVDPKGDTAEAVRRYVRERRLLPTFHYLIGTRARLGRVWKAYRIAVLAGPQATVTHSTVQLLIDPRGRERLTYGSDVTAADVIHDLRRLERRSGGSAP
jgi:protein SCO1/2